LLAKSCKPDNLEDETEFSVGTAYAGESVSVTDELLTLKESGSDVSVKRENPGSAI